MYERYDKRNGLCAKSHQLTIIPIYMPTQTSSLEALTMDGSSKEPLLGKPKAKEEQPGYGLLEQSKTRMFRWRASLLALGALDLILILASTSYHDASSFWNTKR